MTVKLLVSRPPGTCARTGASTAHVDIISPGTRPTAHSPLEPHLRQQLAGCIASLLRAGAR